ncbi:SET domain-containing protein, partial [Mycena rebaudengoi]
MNPSDTLVGGVSSDFSSLAGEYLGDAMSQDDRSEKIEGPQKSRESAPSLPPLQPTRSPVFFAPLDTPCNVLKPRREIIQDQWNKIAREAGAAGIEFVNEVDDEEVPPGIGILFPYVERSYLFDIGIAEPIALAGCECDGKSGCNNARPGRCPCASASSTLKNGPAYTQGLFAFTTESEIVECNSACGCSPQCNNRLAQFPRQIPAQIFKTEKRGWGARLPLDIVRGQMVGLYTGLLIRREEADKLSGSRASYCFDLDVNEDPDEETPENAYSVDAYGCGNWTRFINHSCSPNLQIITIVYDTMPEDNMPYLALVATEDIPAFTELTFDYNPAHQTEWELKRYREKTRSKKNKSKKQTRCLCGASICRGWLSVVA